MFRVSQINVTCVDTSQKTKILVPEQFLAKLNLCGRHTSAAEL